jgi:hypothetical protein
LLGSQVSRPLTRPRCRRHDGVDLSPSFRVPQLVAAYWLQVGDELPAGLEWIPTKRGGRVNLCEEYPRRLSGPVGPGLTGDSYSADFPTRNPVQGPSSSRPYDIVLAKINPSGSALLFSTHFGGSQEDGFSGVAVDRSGNIFLSGATASPDLPVTPGALYTTGTSDGILLCGFTTKFSATGELLYSTYFTPPCECLRARTR